ncbi:MAG: hypothetical protein WAN22_15650 [Solirubrobacteraceae bacterium]
MNQSQSVFECARVPVGDTCSVQLSGERDHVVAAAKQHLVSHGHTNDDQLHANVTRAVDQQEYDAWGG